MIQIDFLAEHPDTISTLASWFRTQWPDYYSNRSLKEIALDFHAERNRIQLPTRLIALMDGVLVGTISLREQATNDLPEYSPGLGGLFVPESRRGQGIATELVKAGMNLAKTLDFDEVFATTVAARGILERLHWKLVREVLHGDEHLSLYRCQLLDR